MAWLLGHDHWAKRFLLFRFLRRQAGELLEGFSSFSIFKVTFANLLVEAQDDRSLKVVHTLVYFGLLVDFDLRSGSPVVHKRRRAFANTERRISHLVDWSQLWRKPDRLHIGLKSLREEVAPVEDVHLHQLWRMEGVELYGFELGESSQFVNLINPRCHPVLIKQSKPL